MAKIIEQLNDSNLKTVFIEKNYGTYHRNLDGLIEHSYYHLGQITLINKMIASSK